MKAAAVLAVTGLGLAWASVPAGGAPRSARASRAPGQGGPAAASPVRAEIAAAALKGMAYLRKTQQSDGSWQHYPGVTALCLLGFLRQGVTDRDPAVARACGYLAGQAKPNGGIYTEALGPAQA